MSTMGGEKGQSCFDLFLRLMDEPKYVGLLFGEISAITQFNRMPGPLAKLSYAAKTCTLAWSTAATIRYRQSTR